MLQQRFDNNLSEGDKFKCILLFFFFLSSQKPLLISFLTEVQKKDVKELPTGGQHKKILPSIAWLLGNLGNLGKCLPFKHSIFIKSISLYKEVVF